MPVAEAVALFVELNGRHPSHPILAAWARDANISLAQSQRTSTWWREALDAAEALLTDRGKAIPASRPTAGRPRKGADRSYRLPDAPLAYAAPGETFWNPERIVAALRAWDLELPSRVSRDEVRYRNDQRSHPEWPAPMTITHHGGWQLLRDHAIERNAAVARGHADAFPVLPSMPDRGEQARRQAREMRVVHSPGHRKRADGARIQVSDLIAAGLLSPDEQLTGRFKGTDHVAVVEPDGQLHVLGKGPAASPSQAEKLASGHPKNGWRFWWVERDGQRLRLEALRDEMFRGD